MTDTVHGINVDYSRDGLFDELGKIRLKESYMKDEEVSPQEGQDPEQLLEELQAIV